jgi:hypothetical protein
MSSIIKVDQIQLADGSTPTAGDLGLNVSGGVLQVIGNGSNALTDVSNTFAWNDVVTVTFTAKGDNSTYVMSGNIPFGHATSTESAHLRFTLNGSAVGVGQASGSRTQANSSAANVYNQNRMNTLTGMHTETSTITAGTTVTVVLQFKAGQSNANSFRINRTGTDYDGDFYARCTSNLQVMEIAG